ncbi:MAG TPA: tetratricopeptide repeat protein [Steroidobacteraceae bacterium]|nr:tetratricopeptide repeat protein [Steroidobacteraceae bacterium]
MKVTRAGALSCALGLYVTFSAVSVPAAEQPAVENRQVADALTEAKELADGKKWDAALAALRRAQQVPGKSAYAEYKIEEFTGYVLAQQRRYGDAASVFARLAESDQAPRADVERHLSTAAQLYLQTRQYSKAAELAKRALRMRPGDLRLLELSGEAQYLAREFKGAAKTLQLLVATTERKGDKPQERWLQLMLDSYYKLDDREAVAATWDALLRHYPKQKYWEAVLDDKIASVDSQPLEFGYRRLMFDLGLLTEAADYEELAMRAIDVGLPGEAVRVMKAALDPATLSLAESKRAHFRRVLRYAEDQVAKERATLEALAESAESAATGQPSVELGRAYLGYGRYDEAISALRSGIEKGNLENADRARVDLGIAYLNNDETEQATRTFAQVEAGSEWRDLAELWSLRATTGER